MCITQMNKGVFKDSPMLYLSKFKSLCKSQRNLTKCQVFSDVQIDQLGYEWQQISFKIMAQRQKKILKVQ